jgi:hypothetical protein
MAFLWASRQDAEQIGVIVCAQHVQSTLDLEEEALAVLAAQQRDVRGEDGRRGVGDLGGRGRIGIVVRQVAGTGTRLHRPGRVEAGERHAVDVELVANALVVAGSGDLLHAHAVPEEEDHVVGVLVDQCGDDPVAALWPTG